METRELNVSIRKEAGKGPSRRLRAGGRVPAVFYGSGSDPISISVNNDDLLDFLKERKESVFIKLMIEDGGSRTEKLAMIKELQTSPVAKSLYHVDFYEVRMDHKIALDVPIHIIGVPAGVDLGGELHQLKREVNISGLPSAMPEFVEVDVSGLGIGDTVMVGDIKLPEGVEALDAPDIAVATVSATRVIAEEAPAEEEEQKQPEVITAKAKEE
jgi:large subunit ribosomal protein L25